MLALHAERLTTPLGLRSTVGVCREQGAVVLRDSCILTERSVGFDYATQLLVVIYTLALDSLNAGIIARLQGKGAKNTGQCFGLRDLSEHSVLLSAPFLAHLQVQLYGDR